MGNKTEVKEKFAGEGYPIHVIGRHIDVTEAMKRYAVEKLNKIVRFGGRVIDVTITMDIQKLAQTVDFLINVNNTKIKVAGRTENMYASIDQAVARLKSKLGRYAHRLHEHHAKGVATVEMEVAVLEKTPALEEINDLIEEETLQQVEQQLRPHAVVSRETRPLKILTQSEAVMKMELSEEPFLLYKSEEENKLRLIYRREDGHYGIIEVEK